MKRIMSKKDLPGYTLLKQVLINLDLNNKDYIWLISDIEAYPSNKELEKEINEKGYLILSTKELMSILDEEDFQWIWGCLCGFTKDIPLEKVLSHPLPSAQDYNGYYQNPLSLQHPLSSIEIIPCDSSWILVVSENKNLIDNYLAKYPTCEDLSSYNNKN